MANAAVSLLRKPSLHPLPWLLCFQFFVVEQLARLHVRGPYSMARNAISDLGARHAFRADDRAPASISPWHALMNASFTLQGMLIVFGALLVRRLLPGGRLATGAWLLFILSGLALCVVGLNPEDVHRRLHLLAAAVHFVAGALAMLLAGFAFLPKAQAAGRASLASGALALSATLLLGLRGNAAWSHLALPAGTVERVAAYPLPLWLTVTGLGLLVRLGQRREVR